MTKPGRAGMLVLLAFTIPAIVETKTLLAMMGYEISTVLFAPLALAAFVLVTSLLIFFMWEDPEEPESPSPE